ncbi:PseG/SpsG family protein [Candidatus Omnitrophota bacterium]
MKTLILTEGGRGIGFGHLSRCLALSQALKQAGAQVKFIIYGDATAAEFLKANKQGASSFNWQKGDQNFINEAAGFDLAIIDSYLAKKTLYDKFSKLFQGRLAMIDDFNRLQYPQGVVISPSIYGHRLAHPEKNGSTYLLGRDYVILRREFRKAARKAINKKIRNILVTFGGIGNYKLAKTIIELLRRKFHCNFQIVEPNKNRFNAKRMLKVMSKADICVSAGGQTTYELARLGVPTIGICFAENQKFNLEFGQELRFIEYVGWHNDSRLQDKIMAAAERLNSRETRLKMSLAGSSYIDGKGAQRIVKHLLHGR